MSRNPILQFSPVLSIITTEAVSEYHDMVLLKTENLSFRQVAQITELTKAKLAARLVGPFSIEYIVIENVARLKLPKRFGRIHPSFNVDLLTPYPEQHERFRSRPKFKETPIEVPDNVDDDGMRIVEKPFAKRQFNRKPEYLVKWLGKPMPKCTWEMEKDIKHVVHWYRLLKVLREQQRAKRSSSRGDCQPAAAKTTQLDDTTRGQARQGSRSPTHDASVDANGVKNTEQHRSSSRSRARITQHPSTMEELQLTNLQPTRSRRSRQRGALPRP